MQHKSGFAFICLTCLFCLNNNRASDPGTSGKSDPEIRYDASDLFSSKYFLTGQIDYYTDPHFIEIPKQYAYREDMFLLKETYEAFYNMYLAAQKDGISLKIISATRTHTEQSWIWEDKWKKAAYNNADQLIKISNIMQFSAMPGTSRHHWGTEIDLNSLSDEYFTTGAGKNIYKWLITHACEFGFCQVYDEAYKNRKGHGEEKWHWSYYPLSKGLPERYKLNVKYSDIKGFSGCELAEQAHVIEDYVLGVSTKCCE